METLGRSTKIYIFIRPKPRSTRNCRHFSLSMTCRPHHTPLHFPCSCTFPNQIYWTRCWFSLYLFFQVTTRTPSSLASTSRGRRGGTRSVAATNSTRRHSPRAAPVDAKMVTKTPAAATPNDQVRESCNKLGYPVLLVVNKTITVGDTWWNLRKFGQNFEFRKFLLSPKLIKNLVRL